MNIDAQYYELRQTIPADYLMFFQMGEFFELFNDDAIKVHQATGITLTKRGNMPMAGVPLKSASFYIRKLVFEHGYTVAMCEQETTMTHKIMNRKITKICTKGTIYDELVHDYNLVMAVYISDKAYMVYGDISTNEAFCETVAVTEVESHVARIAPVKLISNMPLLIASDIQTDYKLCSFDLEYIHPYSMLMQFFESRGYKMQPQVYRSAKQTMYLPASTLKNLEVFTDQTGNARNSLFHLLNRTQTPMGYRLLRTQLQTPSISIQYLNSYFVQLNKVIDVIKTGTTIRLQVNDILRNANNLSNIASLKRLAQNIQNAKEGILAFKHHNILPEHTDISFIDACNIDVYLNEQLQDETFESLPEIKLLIEQREKTLSSIYAFAKYTNNVEAVVERNSVLGSFIQCKTIINDAEYIPLKHLKSVYRYTHKQLLQYDAELNKIDEKIEQIQEQKVMQLINYVKSQNDMIYVIGNTVANLDILQSKAVVAVEQRWHQPVFTTDKQISIQKCYHPILKLKNLPCIHNDLELDTSNQLMVITGPNMGGKSTYLKQNALIVLMAQTGMYIPAVATLPIIDGLFVRMGANDNIFNNDSTFSVEMKECAAFLNRATEHALIIIDEIGRGTEYEEGMSISQAICEYILDTIKCFCLVSTHYLKLPAKLLSNSNIGVVCKQVSYSASGDIVFLYKIIDGVAHSSHSLYTAKLAGIPDGVIHRAAQIYSNNTMTSALHIVE